MPSLPVLFLFCYLTYTAHASRNNYVSRNLLQQHPIGGDGVNQVQKSSGETINIKSPTKKKLEEIQIDVNQDKKDDPKQAAKSSGETISIKGSKNPEETPVVSKKTATAAQPGTNLTTNGDPGKRFKPTEMESGALIRGVLVVVALSVIIMIYMALKTYYGKRNKPIMVRKYGVRTRRSDIEMTPLPLEEDDDDETLFEVGTTNR